jgi:long-chain acyl-CoA synthetase
MGCRSLTLRCEPGLVTNAQRTPVREVSLPIDSTRLADRTSRGEPPVSSARQRAPEDVAARLRVTASDVADRVALVWQDREVTYGELDARVDAAVGALRGLGVSAGDRVAIVLGNVPAFVEVHFATLRAGGVVVPCNLGQAEDEIVHVLADSGARVVVVADAVAPTVLAAAARVEGVEHVVVVGAASAPAGSSGTWRELVAAAQDRAAAGGAAGADAAPAPGDLAALVYTSGTTGLPRGAMLTHRNLTAAQDQSLAGRLRVERDDVVLLVLPLFHIYALNVGLGASVTVGATMVLVERFDATGSMGTIAEHRVTVVLGAPPMYVAWANTPDVSAAPFATVRVAVSGAAPLPVQVLERFREATGVEIWEGYGLTEAAPSVTSNAMGDEARPGSVGLPLPDVELRLVDDAGEDVERGDPGEVWVRGPNVFQGYWQDPEGTAEALAAGGWLRTGDVGVRDADGYLYLVDRKKDLVIVSGFNVYPREVERVLYAHGDVAEAAVVGVPHPYTGEAVKAFVVRRPGTDVGEDDLAAFCRTRLARYKAPESVEFVDALPHTATGKVRRVELRGN